MGSFFRSEPMSFYQIIFQAEYAFDYLAKLGSMGCVRFCEKPHDIIAFGLRRFNGELILCKELENRLKNIQNSLNQFDIPALNVFEVEQVEAASLKELNDINLMTKQLNEEVTKIQSTKKLLTKNLMDLVQLREVLMKLSNYHYKNDIKISESFSKFKDTEKLSININIIAGAIRTDKIHVFERVIFRLTRGLMVFCTETIKIPLEDPITGEIVSKSFFIVFIQSKEFVVRIKKLCLGFNAKVYDLPNNETKREELLNKTINEVLDIRKVIRRTNNQHYHTLHLAAKSLEKWKIQVLKAKSVYNIMNMLSIDYTGNCLVGEVWIPDFELPRVTKNLTKVSKAVGSTFDPIFNKMEIKEETPTYFKQNKFLQGFQALVEAYGIPNYQELNPSVCTIVTFPFLFAVMFGDIGHGIIMFIFGIWMVLKENAFLKLNSKNEIWNIMFSGRYIIAMCGFFSIYTGLIYNDMFSKSLNIFGSAWHVNYNFSTVHKNHFIQLDPNNSETFDPGNPYPFGLDPVWSLASANKIIFQNAFKMKISIILGVIHMLCGIVQSCFNHVYFNNYLAIFTEFIPQIIFMSCIFLYLVVLMFYKWFIYTPADAACAPSLLITFINMLMFKDTEKVENCDEFLYAGQETVQKCLVFTALACVPWMLAIKPLYIHLTRDKVGSKKNLDEEDEISEIIIHQAIHTIEFVLGSVSHTASYLRLWALSLAHSQLAEVLWNMIMNMGIQATGYFSGLMLCVIFTIWAVATVAILVVMEGLSAFLHTLRLHWVESQSKFYLGQGIRFDPFSFNDIFKNM